MKIKAGYQVIKIWNGLAPGTKFKMNEEYTGGSR